MDQGLEMNTIDKTDNGNPSSCNSNGWSKVDREHVASVIKNGSQRWAKAKSIPIKINLAATSTAVEQRSRAPWSEAEDKHLVAAVEPHGRCWGLVSSNLPGRTDDACNARWNRIKFNYPDSWRKPTATTRKSEGSQKKKKTAATAVNRDGLPWSGEEDKQLIAVVEQNNVIWTVDCHTIPGRSYQACYARWSFLKKEEEVKQAINLVRLFKRHGINALGPVDWAAIYSCSSGIVMPKTREECSQIWDAFRKYAWFQEETLGLTIEDIDHSPKGPWAVEVSHIAPGSQAFFDDWLEVGDCVVAVGSKSVLGLPTPAVVSLIRSSPRPLKLTVLDKSVSKEYLTWTVEEDKRLVAAHDTHFPNWIAIGQCLPERPLSTYFKDRCVKNNLPISCLEKYYFNTSSQKKKKCRDPYIAQGALQVLADSGSTTTCVSEKAIAEGRLRVVRSEPVSIHEPVRIQVAKKKRRKNRPNARKRREKKRRLQRQMESPLGGASKQGRREQLDVDIS